MPTYEYDCPDCGGFDAIRSLSMRNEPCACPECGSASGRVFATAPRLACVSSDTRTAMDRNEKARHEPRSSKDKEGSYGRLSHPSGCGCCSTSSKGIRSATVTAANGNKAFPSKRPWMISH